MSGKSLATTKQILRYLNIETKASVKLDDGATAFLKRELTKSANLFLESWRILRNEYESSLYNRLDSLPKREQSKQRQRVVRESRERSLLSFVALHDLAIACSQNLDEYMGPDGKHKLELNAPQLGWSRDTTAEVLDVGEEYEIKTLPKGSPIHGLGIQVMDPLGRLLEEADSFKKAAVIIADICSLQVGCALESSGECLDGYKFIEDSLMWMRLRTSSEAAAIKYAKNAKTFGFDQIQEKDTRDIEEGDEDERTERKLKIKMPELQSKDGPPSLDEDK
jgi:hypothetical protein